jgi:hypothetical protein
MRPLTRGELEALAFQQMGALRQSLRSQHDYLASLPPEPPLTGFRYLVSIIKAGLAKLVG